MVETEFWRRYLDMSPVKITTAETALTTSWYFSFLERQYSCGQIEHV